jgi:cytochrome c oxidase subunit IV
MDIASHVGHMPTAVKLGRGAIFFGWIGAFLATMAVVGLIPTVPIFIVAYMRFEGRERWSLVIPMAVTMTAFIYALFDRLLAIPWPTTLLGTLLPAFKIVPSV